MHGREILKIKEVGECGVGIRVSANGQ